MADGQRAGAHGRAAGSVREPRRRGAGARGARPAAIAASPRRGSRSSATSPEPGVRRAPRRACLMARPAGQGRLPRGGAHGTHRGRRRRRLGHRTGRGRGPRRASGDALGARPGGGRADGARARERRLPAGDRAAGDDPADRRHRRGRRVPGRCCWRCRRSSCARSCRCCRRPCRTAGDHGQGAGARDRAAAERGGARPSGPSAVVAALSGPSFALEVARGLPTAVTIASADLGVARDGGGAAGEPAFRPYPTDDLLGVELAGALKNVVAIAAGVTMGKGLGENARAALITRGLAELTRLALALGARRETLMGLAGLGDLLLTATSLTSRNTSFGYALAKGSAAGRAAGRRGEAERGRVHGRGRLPARPQRRRGAADRRGGPRGGGRRAGRRRRDRRPARPAAAVQRVASLRPQALRAMTAPAAGPARSSSRARPGPGTRSPR